MPEVKEFELKKVKINDIKFDETNPNILSTAQMDALTKVIKKYGYLAPVILNKDMKVVDGEHRVRVYDKLGKKEIPAYVINVNTVDKKMLRQLMNKLRGEHDKKKDADEFKAIFDAGQLKRFSELMAEDEEAFKRSLQRTFKMKFEQPEEMVLPDVPKVPMSKKGDIYQLGKHRLMCGDTTVDLGKLMGKKKGVLVFTDPPYNVAYEQGKYNGAYRSKGRHWEKKKFKPILNDKMEDDKFYEFILTAFTSVKQHIENAPIYVCSPSMRDSFLILEALIDSGYHMQSQLIWKKETFILGRADYHWRHEIIWYGYSGSPHYWCGDRSQDTIWEVSRGGTANYTHPTQKPTDLSAKAIKNSSKPGDIILDPFCGSGSTLIACEQNERICYAMELDPTYVDVIIQRWENHTGKKAKKITS